MPRAAGGSTIRWASSAPLATSQVPRSRSQQTVLLHSGTEGGRAASRWAGSLAAADGLSGVAGREQLTRAFSGVHPDGFKMTAHDLDVVGFDLTLSPSKSVSLIWALGSDNDARQVEEALYAARDEVERYLESTACFVRRGHAGAVVEPGKGFFGAVFMHRTSRLGDPGIHLHWTVFNVTEGPDGRRTSLDASKREHTDSTRRNQVSARSTPCCRSRRAR